MLDSHTDRLRERELESAREIFARRLGTEDPLRIIRPYLGGVDLSDATFLPRAELPAVVDHLIATFRKEGGAHGWNGAIRIYAGEQGDEAAWRGVGCQLVGQVRNEEEGIGLYWKIYREGDDTDDEFDDDEMPYDVGAGGPDAMATEYHRRYPVLTRDGRGRAAVVVGRAADAAAELAGLGGRRRRGRVVREAAAGNRDDAGETREGTVRVTSHRHTADVELVGAGGRRVGRLLKANHGHVAKLRAMHDAFGGDAPFEEDLFRVLCRYAGAAGHGFHAALPSRAFACLRDVGGVTLECFASPLNCYFSPFCSASLVDDAPFGSIGSFFDFHPTGGSYEVNPPFVDDVLARAVDHARELLAAATKPLSFVFVVPGWTDSDAWARLSGSPFLRDGPLLVAADDHGYVDGAQHSRRDRHRASPYDTAFFFLQNDAGYAAWPPKRTKPALRRAMASGKPTDAEARRRARAAARRPRTAAAPSRNSQLARRALPEAGRRGECGGAMKRADSYGAGGALKRADSFGSDGGPQDAMVLLQIEFLGAQLRAAHEALDAVLLETDNALEETASVAQLLEHCDRLTEPQVQQRGARFDDDAHGVRRAGAGAAAGGAKATVRQKPSAAAPRRLAPMGSNGHLAEHEERPVKSFELQLPGTRRPSAKARKQAQGSGKAMRKAKVFTRLKENELQDILKNRTIKAISHPMTQSIMRRLEVATLERDVTPGAKLKLAFEKWRDKNMGNEQLAEEARFARSAGVGAFVDRAELAYDAFVHANGEFKAKDVYEAMVNIRRPVPLKCIEMAFERTKFKPGDALSEPEFLALTTEVEDCRARLFGTACEDFRARFTEFNEDEWDEGDTGRRAKSWVPGVALRRPDDYAVQMFNALVVCLLIAQFVFLPVELAFDEVAERHDVFLFGVFVDVFFCLDVVKNFFVGFEDDKQHLVMDRRKTAARYAKGWLVVDLASSVPASAVLERLTGRSFALLRSKRALKLLRWERIVAFVKLVSNTAWYRKLRNSTLILLDESNIRISDSVIKLLRLFCVLLALAHWLGCSTYMLCRLWDFPEESWIVQAGLMDKQGENRQSVLDRYTWCVYKTLGTFVSVAYEYPGVAQTCVGTTGWCKVESWVTLLCLYVGTVFFAMLVSNMAAIIANANVGGHKFEEKLCAALEYMHMHNFPRNIIDRVKDYYYVRFVGGKLFDEESILVDLNVELRKEIALYNTRALRPKTPGASRGDMFFVNNGFCEVLLRAANNLPLRFLASGCYFGESAALLGVKRTATIRAAGALEVFALPPEVLLQVCSDFPEVGVYMKEVSLNRVQMLMQYDPGAEIDGVQDADYVDSEDAMTPFYMEYAGNLHTKRKKVGTFRRRVGSIFKLGKQYTQSAFGKDDAQRAIGTRAVGAKHTYAAPKKKLQRQATPYANNLIEVTERDDAAAPEAKDDGSPPRLGGGGLGGFDAVIEEGDEEDEDETPVASPEARNNKIMPM
ncbi:voltage-gated potassium channel [Aureococcus anophagefferens]|nr:voltage-gated potassium channel [Aureococcus anophagefferens]